MVEPNHPILSIRKQCEWLGLNRSTYYFQPQGETEKNLKLMRQIDEIYTEHPFYVCRKFAAILCIDKDHANRLMRKMGIETIYQKPRITVPNADHEIYPYLLRDVKIARPDHVWSTDITYVPMMKGFVYLVAVIDWFSRKRAASPQTEGPVIEAQMPLKWCQAVPVGRWCHRAK
ncbi:MAG: hypothetical protein ACRC2T_16375 [Thermoguttaceae bacterium]